MKKILVILLSLLLVVLSIPMAGASGPREYKARDMELNKYTGAIACRLEDANYYTLMNADGEILVTEASCFTSMRSDGIFFQVEKKVPDGIHREGLIDSQGKLIIPVEYADISIVSDRWQVGIKLTPSTADDKDYTYSNWSNNDKSFYRIDAADFYFDGMKVGTLNRSDFGENYCTAFGAYICVTNRAREKVFYNSKMEKSPYVSEYSSAQEYDEVYQKGKTSVYHRGTGQQAFVSTCTLDPADLDRLYRYDHGFVFDVHGNEVSRTPQAYDTVYPFKSGYATVRIGRMNGLISLDGREVIPLEYDSVGNYEDEPLKYGCISAVKDGKFGFLDADGNVTSDFVYAENIVSNKTTFATLKNLDGTMIVISGVVGELPEHYAEVSVNYNGAAAFTARNSDGQYCVVDLSGNTLVPYGDYKILEVSLDASVVLGYYGNRDYVVYHFTPYPVAGAASPGQPDDTPEEKPVEKPEETRNTQSAENKPAAEDGWTCENGHSGNHGNFCSECGAPKPEEKAPSDEDGWTCENGHSGNKGNFCSECGAPKPADKAEQMTHCPNCNYEFGDTVPRFCPSCGTQVAVQ